LQISWAPHQLQQSQLVRDPSDPCTRSKCHCVAKTLECRSLLDLWHSASILAWNVLVCLLPNSIRLFIATVHASFLKSWKYLCSPQNLQAIDSVTFRRVLEGPILPAETEAPSLIAPPNLYIPRDRPARSREPVCARLCVAKHQQDGALHNILSTRFNSSPSWTKAT
jgi:hypothetical protein